MFQRVLLPALLASAFAFGATAEARKSSKERKITRSRVIKVESPRAVQKAFIDPHTKKVRQPTPDEAAEAAAGTPVIEAVPVRELTWSDGTVAIELNEDFQMEVVTVKKPDGSVSTRCDSPAPALEVK